MKKEIAIKKTKVANELQKPIVLKEEIKTVKVAKSVKEKKDLTIHEFIAQPIILIPTVFVLLFAALALWTAIIPLNNTVMIAGDIDPSFRIKDSIYLEQSTTKNGVPYSISIKYPQILSHAQPAQSFGEQISADVVDAAQMYFKKLDEKGNNEDIENILEGTYTFTSEKDSISGDIASVTLNIHQIGKNKISSNPEDNSDVLISKEYKFNITQNQVIDIKQLVSNVN